MKLTFGQIKNAGAPMGIILNSKVITDYKLGIKLALIKKPFIEAQEALQEALRILEEKYIKIAKNGRLSLDQYKDQQKEYKELDELIYDIDIDFPVIDEKNMEILFKGSKELDNNGVETGAKEGALTPFHISILQELGIVKL